MSKQVSPRQMEMLLDFLEQHHFLAMGQHSRGKEGIALSKRLWSECTAILNTDLRGLHKSADEWKRYFYQYKSRTRAKLRNIQMMLEKTGGWFTGGTSLSPLERRLIGILGGSSSPLSFRHTLSDATTIGPGPGGHGSGDHGGGGDMPAEDHVIMKQEETGVITGTQADIQKVEIVVDDSSPKKPSAKEDVEITVKKHRRLQSASSSKENKESEEAEQQQDSTEEICIEKELAQAIRRSATAMEDLASAACRFVDLYEESVRLGRKPRKRCIRISSSSSSDSKDDRR